jgi:hypothetical protein
MKRVILTLTLMLLCCSIAQAADPNQSMTLWLSAANPAYQNTDLSVWLGFRQDNTEIGAAMDWRVFSEGDTEDDTQSNFAVGPYAVYHFPGVIDVNNPFDVPWLGDKLIGDPFIGMSYLFDVDGKGTTFSPVAGVRIFNMFALTYQYSLYYGNPATDEGRIGLSLKYDF